MSDCFWTNLLQTPVLVTALGSLSATAWNRRPKASGNNCGQAGPATRPCRLNAGTDAGAMSHEVLCLGLLYGVLEQQNLEAGANGSRNDSLSSTISYPKKSR